MSVDPLQEAKISYAAYKLQDVLDELNQNIPATADIKKRAYYPDFYFSTVH